MRFTVRDVVVVVVEAGMAVHFRPEWREVEEASGVQLGKARGCGPRYSAMRGRYESGLSSDYRYGRWFAAISCCDYTARVVRWHRGSNTDVVMAGQTDCMLPALRAASSGNERRCKSNNSAMQRALFSLDASS